MAALLFSSSQSTQHISPYPPPYLLSPTRTTTKTQSKEILNKPSKESQIKSNQNKTFFSKLILEMWKAYEGVIAALASFFAVTLILSAIFLFCNKRAKRHQTRSRGVSRARARNRTVPNNNSELSSITFGESATFDPSLTQIAMADLLAATQNFSPDLIVGDGSFGYVYKAKLSTGVVVAVKKLAPDAFQGFREFRAEMETLGKLRHSHIVKILGYCVSGVDRVLIYEFIEKGSLDQWLHDTSSTDYSSSIVRTPLSWGTRIKIIKGVAKGLAYMHKLETPIIHRDIKTSNVLLDADFEAHIADFGLARRIEGSHSHVSTQVAGTMGYMPPEYISGAAMATTMGDIYSFGVLMLEIITGRRPNFPFSGEDGKEIRLVEWVNGMAKQNRYIEMVDTNILKDDLKENSVIECFKIATRCASEYLKDRPSMEKVLELLDGLSTNVDV